MAASQPKPLNPNKTKISKRIAALKKKSGELAMLSHVDLCMVCYGPDGTVHTWPENQEDVKSTVLKLQKQDDGSDKRKMDLLGFLEQKECKELKKEFDDEISDLITKLGDFPDSPLLDLLGFCESNMKGLEKRIELMKKGKDKKGKKKEIVSGGEDEINQTDSLLNDLGKQCGSHAAMLTDGSDGVDHGQDQGFATFANPNYMNVGTSGGDDMMNCGFYTDMLMGGSADVDHDHDQGVSGFANPNYMNVGIGGGFSGGDMVNCGGLGKQCGSHAAMLTDGSDGVDHGHDQGFETFANPNYMNAGTSGGGDMSHMMNCGFYTDMLMGGSADVDHDHDQGVSGFANPNYMNVGIGGGFSGGDMVNCGGIGKQCGSHAAMLTDGCSDGVDHGHDQGFETFANPTYMNARTSGGGDMMNCGFYTDMLMDGSADVDHDHDQGVSGFANPNYMNVGIGGGFSGGDMGELWRIRGGGGF